MNDYFNRARATLEILMARIGLTILFKKIVYQYEKDVENKFLKTLVKLLLRCDLTFKAIQKLEKIFKMH